MNQHVTGAKPESPVSFTQRILDRCKFDEEAAVVDIIAAAHSNQSLRDELVRRGAKDLVSYVARSHNRDIYSGDGVYTPTIVAASTEALQRAQVRAAGAASRQVRMLLDAYLPNRVKMRDATRADIQDAIAVYEPQAKDMAQKVVYFRKVLAGLKDDQTVGQVYDDRALTKILKSARE